MTHDQERPSRSIDEGNTIDDAEIQKIVEFYEAELQERTTGPQLEGVEGSKLAEALKAEPGNVVLLDILGDDGEIKGRWPLLIPIKYHQDYSQEFFTGHYPDEPVYFFSLPAHDDIEAVIADPDRLSEASEFLTTNNAIVTYDYRVDEGEAKDLIPAVLDTILKRSDAQLEDITPESEAWGMKYGLPKVVFYEGKANRINRSNDSPMSIKMAINHIIAEREIEVMPELGVTFLSPDQLRENNNELLEKMWRMYNAQFNTLVEDHPALFQQPKEEFEEMLLDPDTVNVSFMYEGRPIGLLYLVSNIEKCIWLNKNYYDEKYADEDWVAFFPGVVVAEDMAQKDLGFVQEMMNVVAHVCETAGKDFIIACACSNVSMTYIRKMIEQFIESNYKSEERRAKYPQRFTFERTSDEETGMNQTAEYHYRVGRIIPRTA